MSLSHALDLFASDRAPPNCFRAPRRSGVARSRWQHVDAARRDHSTAVKNSGPEAEQPRRSIVLCHPGVRRPGICPPACCRPAPDTATPDDADRTGKTCAVPEDFGTPHRTDAAACAFNASYRPNFDTGLAPTGSQNAKGAAQYRRRNVGYPARRAAAWSSSKRTGAEQYRSACLTHPRARPHATTPAFRPAPPPLYGRDPRKSSRTAPDRIEHRASRLHVAASCEAEP